MLTAKQETFAQAVAAGKSHADAYREAYPASANWKPQSVWQKASQMLDNVKVMSRVEALQAELAAQNLWTKRRAVELLVKMVESESKPGDVLAVVKVLNAMHGFDGPGEDEGGDGKPSTVVLVIGGQNIDPKKLGW
jgi:hypothetical protein